MRKYPWDAGEGSPPSPPNCSRATYNRYPDGAHCQPTTLTLPADSLPEGASPYGALNIAGNVDEWVSDWYANSAFGSESATDPTGPPSGTVHTVKGGSWDDTPDFLRASWRGPGPTPFDELAGFRCCRQL